MAVAIRPLDQAVTAAWDAFVAAHPDGTFFHRAAWATIIEQAFGHRTFYVYAERDGAITGVLPLAQVKTLLFGNALISVPFCVYGGPLAVDRETAAALSAHAASLLKRTGAGAVEYRFRDPGGGMHCETTATSPGFTASAPNSAASCASQNVAISSSALLEEIARPGPAEAIRNTPSDDAAGQQILASNGNRDAAPDGWLTRPDLYVTFRKAIEADHDKNLKSVPRKQRAMVRKAIQNGLRSVVDRDARKLHGIYAESVRNLGTPVFSLRYFALLAEVFAADCDIVTVLDDANPIAAVMNFYFRDEVLPYYGGGTAFARQRAGNDFMYWEVMRRAADRGCRMFDFGRSKLGTGAFDFKKNWGFAPEHLSYRYKLAPGASIPDHNPLNPKYRYFIAIWKQLPLPIANAIGPSIVRGLG
jgi:FemAB-related protein (PEP-CTERM system-associated)